MKDRRILNWLQNLFLNLLTSSLISVLLFVAGLSIVTRQFPPPISKIRQALDSAKNLALQSQVVPTLKHLDSATPFGDSSNEDEKMVSSLEKIHKKRAALARDIPGVDENAGAQRKPSSYTEEPSYKEVYADLAMEERMSQAERLIMQLQNRVEELNRELGKLKKSPETFSPSPQKTLPGR